MSNIIAPVDVRNNVINVGDIVYRAVFSDLSIHKVEKINKASIVLSCKRVSFNGHLFNTSWIARTNSLESLSEHNDTFYYIRTRQQTGLIKI